MKRFRIASLALLMVGFAACDSLKDLTELEVPNENNPDRERVTATANDVQSVIGSALLIWWEGVEYSSPSWALSTAADEGTMSWGNFGMQQLSSEPRVQWPNDPAFTYRRTTEAAWYACYGALSSVYDGLNAIEDLPELADEIDVDRATAFAKVVQGLSHGFLALMYDSAFIFDEDVDLFEADGVTPKKLPLVPYPDVYAAAVAELQEAISIATAPGVDFTLQPEWFGGNAMSNTELAQLAHSYLARLMSQVPRAPAERAVAPWATIISHVDAGITEDISVVTTDSFERFFRSLHWYGFVTDDDTWARADYKTIGWTDKSGEFAAWLATPAAQRDEFLLDTDDRRIVGTGTPPAGIPQAPGTDFEYMGPSQFPSARGTYHYSFYVGNRFDDYPGSDATVPARWMTTVEMQQIKAEGLLRTGGAAALPQVVAIINATRVTRGQLAAATIADADLMDKLIYEKRIEGYLLCSGCAYFDRRGFGPPSPTTVFHQGPVEGTPAHFAPPGKELQTLGLPLYSYGGVGNEGGTLQPSGAPAWEAGSGSRTWAAASTVYVPSVRRHRSPEVSSGAASLAGRRY